MSALVVFERDMMSALRLISLSVFLPLMACGTLVEKSPPVTPVEAVDTDIPAKWKTIDTDVGAVSDGWSEALGDPLLSALIAEAQEKNRNIRAAAATVARSLALARQAGAQLGPQVNLNAGGGRQGSTATGDINSFNAGLQASWEVDVWGRIRSGKNAATASAAAAEADYRFARLSLAAGVARTYFLAIEAMQQEVVAEGIVTALTETGRIVSLRYDNGLATAQDFSLAKADLANARGRLVTAAGGRRDALRALEVLLGRYPGADISVGTVLPKLPDAPPAGLPSEILARRPDLVAAERRIAAALDTLDQARVARLPSLSLTGSTGGGSAELATLLSPANIAWTATANLLAPLMDGGARRAQIDIATADRSAAIAAYANAALSAFSEVEKALDDGHTLRQRNRYADEANAEFDNALRLGLLRYGEGETDILSVLQIQQQVYAAQSNALTVKRLLLDQFIGLNLALGGNWRSPEPPPNPVEEREK